MCNHHLNDALFQIGFKLSDVDDFMWYRDKTISFYYVDDEIFMLRDSGSIDKGIEEVDGAGLDIEGKGSIDDYHGVNIEEQGKGKINITQPQTIDTIINDVQLPKNTAPRQTPALFTNIMRRNAAVPTLDDQFNYRSVVGKLNFLEKSTRPNLAYTTHQCENFSQDPKVSHRDVIIHLFKYLKATKTQGIPLDPEVIKIFEVYADADFFGNWYRPTAGNDLSTAKSRTGYAIMYAGCPTIWCIKT